VLLTANRVEGDFQSGKRFLRFFGRLAGLKEFLRMLIEYLEYRIRTEGSD
jgi:hypothetical protein